MIRIGDLREVALGICILFVVHLANGQVLEPFGMEFVKISAGEFQMGCSSDESPYMPDGTVGSCAADSKPQHRVRITRAFELGKFEVTQEQWQSVMGSNPSYFKGSDHPVEQILWTDTQEFLSKLNARQDGYHYRLPTEAEWEYAARAGSTKPFGEVPLGEAAWYRAGPDTANGGTTMTESKGHTYPVGGKRPNAWGLYDMQGNVGEWVQDWYSASYYKASPVNDPKGPTEGQYHVSRGGTWYANGTYMRLWNRYQTVQVLKRRDVGFRCVRENVR